MTPDITPKWIMHISPTKCICPKRSMVHEPECPAQGEVISFAKQSKEISE